MVLASTWFVVGVPEDIGVLDISHLLRMVDPYSTGAPPDFSWERPPKTDVRFVIHVAGRMSYRVIFGNTMVGVAA